MLFFSISLTPSKNPNLTSRHGKMVHLGQWSLDGGGSREEGRFDSRSVLGEEGYNPSKTKNSKQL